MSDTYYFEIQEPEQADECAGCQKAHEVGERVLAYKGVVVCNVECAATLERVEAAS